MESLIDDVLYPARKVLNKYSISDRTLDRWLADSALGFPRPTMIQGRRYWRAAELAVWERAAALRPYVSGKGKADPLLRARAKGGAS
jgi:hypothetical protein